jgi:hypothetical protein
MFETWTRNVSSNARRCTLESIRCVVPRATMAALAVGLAISTLAAPSAALAAPQFPLPPTDPAPLVPISPGGSRPDLTPFLFQSNTDVQPGQAVYFSITNRNIGTAPAGASRTVMGLAKEFSQVQVDFAPGSTCTVQYNNAGWLPGWWVKCDAGSLGAGQNRVIRVTAIAPTTPGGYKVLAESDANGQVAESNESNNTKSVTLNVQ